MVGCMLYPKIKVGCEIGIRPRGSETKGEGAREHSQQVSINVECIANQYTTQRNARGQNRFNVEHIFTVERPLKKEP